MLTFFIGFTLSPCKQSIWKWFLSWNYYFTLHRYLVQIFNQKKSSLALPLLKPFLAPGGSDSITKPAVWKQASIRAHQMIKEGWNSFKFPLHHLVLETNYSHTITSWALKSTNSYEFSLMLSLRFLFLQRFSRYIDSPVLHLRIYRVIFLFLVQDDSASPLLALVIHARE